MHLPRTLNQLICRVLIGVFLFAQLAITGHACPGLGQQAPKAAMQAEMADAMPAGCDHMGQKSANLCVEHCKAGQQSADTAPAPVVMAPALALLYELADDAGHADQALGRPGGDPLLAATPAPHAILHCVLRI
jgi:hypothetical protein